MAVVQGDGRRTRHASPCHYPVITVLNWLDEMECTSCVRRFAYRCCAAFPDGIPLAIWLGKDTHQAAYPGDGGIHFKPIPGATVTTPQVTEGDKVPWSLVEQEEAREPQPV